MEKMEIEGMLIRYKNFTHLNEMVKKKLTELQGIREKHEKELDSLKKQERALRKFLGLKNQEEKGNNL